MLSPLNEFFFIKTDNPDPNSFRFVDTSSIYKGESGEPGSISPIQMLYADVVYENKKTFRVKGGYLARGVYTDGGEVKLQSAKVTDSYPCYNLSTGETTMEYSYEYKDTNVKIKLGSLVDETDYLIQKYAGKSSDFFSKMDAIESGFSSICLYNGVYVKGTLKKSDSKWGISTSPHADQTFYIQDPYYRASDGEQMFISTVYPFRHDSLGFPSMMGEIAKRLNPKATYKWTDTHYLIEVTLNGKTKTYGGAGTGGGQGIRKSDIKYYYKFDGSSSDQAKDKSLSSLKNKNCAYGKLDIPAEKKEGEITWSSILQTVGEGSYVKVVLLTSVFGGSDTGFSYIYDDGYSSVGYISNAWYDGRYFNKWECFYPGAAFEETVESEEPSLVFKDFTLKLPDDGRDYLYWYEEIGTDTYDPDTGIWKGYTTFCYDAATKTWKTGLLDAIAYYSEDERGYHNIDDQDFINACTITMDEARAMNLDNNTNTDPSAYYVYDMEEEPGTYHAGA